MKKTTRLIGIFAIATALTIVLSAGIAAASRPVVPTPETENIHTVTIVECIGAMQEKQSLVWDVSNEDLLNSPPLDLIGEVIGKMTYDQDMVVTDGYIELSKNFEADTGDGQNLDVMLSYGYSQATPYGATIGQLSNDEEISMSIVADWEFTDAVIMCPFASAALFMIPAGCEEVTMGSKIVVTEALATTIGEIEMTDSPITVHYQIDAGGLGGVGTLAVGTGEAFMSVSVEDGSADEALGITELYTLGSRLTYEEKTVANGLFDLYKSMDYKSVIRPTGPVPV